MSAPILRLDDVDPNERLGKKSELVDRLRCAQLRLLYLQRQVHARKLRAVLVFEGWDAAGKGGAIRRVTERLDPRGVRVHAIAAPEPEDRGRHYLHRFWTRLPKPGRIAIFDRSWYGRLLVERVERFCDEAEWQRAYREIGEFERQLTDDGIALVKCFLHISKDEQLKRFEARKGDPFKSWKLTDDDWRNREKWDDYAAATDDMLARTHAEAAPWKVVAGNHKASARVTVAEHVVDRLSDAFDVDCEKLPKGWKLPR